MVEVEARFGHKYREFVVRQVIWAVPLMLAVGFGSVNAAPRSHDGSFQPARTTDAQSATQDQRVRELIRIFHEAS